MFLKYFIIFQFMIAQLNGSLSRSPRWSIFYPLEEVCVEKCRDKGKPFGRLIGGTCSCYCPVTNPPADNDPCDDSVGPSCQLFCQLQNYSGGDCLAGGLCWCFCRVKDPYPPLLKNKSHTVHDVIEGSSESIFSFSFSNIFQSIINTLLIGSNRQNTKLQDTKKKGLKVKNFIAEKEHIEVDSSINNISLNLTNSSLLSEHNLTHFINLTKVSDNNSTTKISTLFAKNSSLIDLEI